MTTAARAEDDQEAGVPRRRGERLLEFSMFIPRRIDEVFAFFEDAGNLEAITPPWLRFRIVTPRPIAMRPGALIDYTLRLRGVPMRWRTEIAVYEPPHRFVDQQLKGPYRLWVHEHVFHEVGATAERPAGTVMEDRVRYVLPGGGMAGLVHRWLVRPDLERIFGYRREMIGRLMGTPG